MGRPGPKEPLVNTAVRLPVSLHARVHEVANERCVSANLIMVRALEVYLRVLEHDRSIVKSDRP